MSRLCRKQELFFSTPYHSNLCAVIREENRWISNTAELGEVSSRCHHAEVLNPDKAQNIYLYSVIGVLIFQTLALFMEVVFQTAIFFVLFLFWRGKCPHDLLLSAMQSGLLIASVFSLIQTNVDYK